MSNPQPAPDPVPYEEVAAVLGEVVARAGGGPPGLMMASGRQLAAALEAAGWRVVRVAPASAQLTLW